MHYSDAPAPAANRTQFSDKTMSEREEVTDLAKQGDYLPFLLFDLRLQMV